MRPSESPEAAAARAGREELGARARVHILGGDGARVEERESASNPGLANRYVLHAVDDEVVDGLPEDGSSRPRRPARTTGTSTPSP
ncbi:unnamed protein product [Miscanthus lutarioriparius]|uniref:Uncharacterized protein n=1 Tax=Miscanthus lutarioriparius TaxID=422564 RepID=A0A811SN13_9POAL|nr:unnamed protein product [Miscanthus lutarioriparius]